MSRCSGVPAYCVTLSQCKYTRYPGEGCHLLQSVDDSQYRSSSSGVVYGAKVLSPPLAYDDEPDTGVGPQLLSSACCFRSSSDANTVLKDLDNCLLVFRRAVYVAHSRGRLLVRVNYSRPNAVFFQLWKLLLVGLGVAPGRRGS